MKIVQLENRIKILIDENRKLTSNVKDRINELEEGRITISELEVALHGLRSYETDLQRLRDLVMSKENEINDVILFYIASGATSTLDWSRVSYNSEIWKSPSWRRTATSRLLRLNSLLFGIANEQWTVIEVSSMISFDSHRIN